MMRAGSYKALITGATGAIGSITALELAKVGADIALHYHNNEKRALEIASKIEPLGRKAVLVKADFKKVSKVEKMVDEAAGKLNGLNLLIHCAANFVKTPFETVKENIFDEIMAVNLKASFFLAQEAAHFMHDGGRMIFLSDVAALKPYASYLPYCMAKGGIDTMVKGLAKKLSPKISVVGLAPYLATRPEGISDKGWNDMINKTPAHRISPPEEIVQMILFLAQASPSVTGQIISIDGGRLLR